MESGDLLQHFLAVVFKKLDKGESWDDDFELNTVLQVHVCCLILKCFLVYFLENGPKIILILVVLYLLALRNFCLFPVIIVGYFVQASIV